jgi:glutathione synthase/RimK-type ligase-like ATP-grasp enzyme
MKLPHTYGEERNTGYGVDVGDFDISRVVLKRTHSDMGQHVILPQDGREKYTREYVEGHSEIPGCIWLIQSYVDTLAALGEWRVFIIGGQIVYIVHTRRNRTKGSSMAQTPINYYTLEELM